MQKKYFFVIFLLSFLHNIFSSDLPSSGAKARSYDYAEYRCSSYQNLPRSPLAEYNEKNKKLAHSYQERENEPDALFEFAQSYQDRFKEYFVENNCKKNDPQAKHKKVTTSHDNNAGEEGSEAFCDDNSQDEDLEIALLDTSEEDLMFSIDINSNDDKNS